ncbi:MAG: phytanoyl-CoA dioxygenase family protein, partial [Actinomycetota bacterium]
ITIGDYSLADEQTRLHVDSVFHTHEVWLYLTDVTEENAPLVYVPRSHHLDAVRLRAEYRDSVDPSRCIDPSRRVPDAEMERRGLTPQVVTCPKNTLVIADTCGYHARAIGQDGGHRRALYMFFRSNPFRYPWPRTRRTLGSVRRAVVGRRPG